MASQSLPDNLSPDAVDTLTELSQILTRLRAAQASGAGLASLPSGATPSAGMAAPAPVTGTTPLPSTAPNTAAATASISLKDVPTATDHLKHKLQKARAQIKTLPDMGRTLAEQDAELRELESRTRRQREVLDRLREVGILFGAEDGVGRDRMEM